MKTAKILLLTALAVLCVNPVITQGNNELNLLLCGVLCISPAVLLFRGARVLIPRIDVPAGLVCLFVMAWPAIFHPETIRPATMLFTCAYCVFMAMVARLLLIARLSTKEFMTLSRCIIYAFAAMLIMQQICVLVGWPVINCRRIYPDVPWKLNALMSESSHTAVVLTAVMFFYVRSFAKENPGLGFYSFFKRNIAVSLCWLWVMFTCYASSAFVLAPLCALPLLNRRNLPYVGAAVALCIAVLFFTPLREHPLPGRVIAVARVLPSMDEETIIDTDISAAFRIVPSIRGAKALATSGTELITGHGVDADKYQLPKRPGLPGEVAQLGFAGIFSLCYNYGLPCALALWWLGGVCTLRRRDWLSVVAFLFFFQMSADYNVQLPWTILAFSLAFKTIVCRDKTLHCIGTGCEQTGKGIKAYTT